MTALLHRHRHAAGTRKRRRAGSELMQAKLVLRWFHDDVPIRLPAAEVGLAISTPYRYLHEAIGVIAETSPDLRDVLELAKQRGWSHLALDGTLIRIDRANERNDDGVPTLTDKGYEGIGIGCTRR